MYGNKDQTGDSLEDRVYCIYSSQHGIADPAINQPTYDQQVNAITAPPGSGWRPSRKDWAYVWDNFSASDRSVDYRVYVNAKPSTAVHHDVGSSPPASVAPSPSSAAAEAAGKYAPQYSR